MYDKASVYYNTALNKKVCDVYSQFALDYEDMSDWNNAIKYYKLSVENNDEDTCGIKPLSRLKDLSRKVFLKYRKERKYIDATKMYIIYQNYIDESQMDFLLQDIRYLSMPEDYKFACEMLLLEHCSNMINNKNISLKSHYAFCKRRHESENILKYFVQIPNDLINMIIEY